MTEINQLSKTEDRGVDAPDTSDISDFKGKKIVLTTFGSYGDLHPYIAIGLELKARGHRVVLATTPVYREKIEATGLFFHPIRPDLPSPEENTELVRKAMDLKKGAEFIIKDLIANRI